MGSHDSKVQIYSGFWPGLTQGLKQCHQSQVSALFHVLATFSDQLYSPGPQMAALTPGPWPCGF